MWTFANCDLKYRLTLRISAVSVICFAVISAVVLWDIDRSVRTELDDIADISARTLQLQLNKTHWINNPPSTFPDLDSIASSVMRPGLCIAYRAGNGQMIQQFCSGARTQGTPPPLAFAVLHRTLFDPGREAAKAVLLGDRPMGAAVAWVDPSVVTAETWRELSRLLPVLAGALVLLCVLAYAALARALRPTRLIRAGLERIAANDLTARLPPFDLAELSAIRDAFNQLAENLAEAIAERNALTRRLIALQDDERRHLARELHDEFGQSLAAIRALASAAGHSAAESCPELASECDSIGRTAADMMTTLRGALFRLRPPDIDELGLAASLEGLVSGWSRRQCGRTHFAIRLSGAIDSLPDSIGLNLYRIAQEALTNAARHADAKQVLLQLTVRDANEADPAQAATTIELTIEDDGAAGDQVGKPGMGLLGIRERVASLGGRLTFETRPCGGARLHVVIPLVANSSLLLPERRPLAECAA
jgi:signal transduction histidine kinase